MSYVKFDGTGTADIDVWIEDGVPGVSLTNANDRYFHFHHTEGTSIYSLAYLHTYTVITNTYRNNMSRQRPKDGRWVNREEGRGWLPTTHFCEGQIRDNIIFYGTSKAYFVKFLMSLYIIELNVLRKLKYKTNNLLQETG